MALVLAPEAPTAEWLAALDAQIDKSPTFFDGRPVILDFKALPAEQSGVAELIEALRERGIRVIGAEGVHPSWKGVERWGQPLSGSRPGKSMELPGEAPPAVGVQRPQPAVPAAAPTVGTTLIVEHGVRSGQSVIHDRGDVVIIGSVASGAEIMAAGSVHIYGALRGRVIAGTGGNAGARIFCQKLDAELVAIDGLYRTADDIEASLRGRAVQAWLDGATMKLVALD